MMFSIKRVALLAAGIVALMTTTDRVSAGPSNSCNLLLSDTSYPHLLGCARGNVPQNYTDSSQMQSALNTFCADNHKCDEDRILRFLAGLIDSCGPTTATDPNAPGYKLFTDLYTAVPRWQSYCRKDKDSKYCLMQPGANKSYGPREHSFTCDVCGQLRVEAYSNWEQRTSSKLGKPLALIGQDFDTFNKKCPDFKAVIDKNGGQSLSKDSTASKGTSANGSSGVTPESSKYSLLVAMITLLIWTL